MLSLPTYYITGIYIVYMMVDVAKALNNEVSECTGRSLFGEVFFSTLGKAALLYCY